ncbi:MAG TPA: hypothetical protein VF139_19380, partial [Candidatus Polarisedimenticolaceae bacterium]
MSAETPTPSPFDLLVERILKGEAPQQARAAAARGALPLPKPTLVRLYLALREDPVEEVRSDATRSLEALHGESLREILADPACTAEVLAHFAPAAARDEKLAEAVAFHANVPDAALAALATSGSAAVCELVLTNQQRLLSSPKLLDRLSTNPALRADQRARIVEMFDRFLGERAEAGEPSPEGEGDAQEVARLLELDVGELYASSEIVDGEEFAAHEDPVIRSTYKKILTLNTAQKAILAIKGGREERLILVRDTNKVVSLAVLKNGRITEQEIETIANMRNVSDEILRQVGINREWSKNYTVVTALVRNPRTPPSVSTNFVGRLNNKDLKTLAGDKGVPEIIRKMAKRTFDLRTQQSAPSFKK